MNDDYMKETNAHINNQSLDLTDLLYEMASGYFPNLKIFMYRGPYDFKLPQNFLWVDRNNFGKVTVKDIGYSGNTVTIEVREYTTDFVREVHVDINEEPDFLMVRWDDVVKMVMNEYRTSTSDDQLLDFDY